MHRMKREELVEILFKSNGAYVSGEDLARHFGCSRAAIWKSIATLRSAGYAIEAVTNHGYRLSSPGQTFQNKMEDRLLQKGLDRDFSIRVKERTLSTNLDAREAGERGEKEFTIYSSLSQTRGRGRRGRIFISDNEDGLWFSILLRPKLSLREVSSVTLLFGLIVLRAISKVCHIHVGLKWPNDIISLQNGKKVCGILSETSMEENRISYAIVGCGINVSQTGFPEEIDDVATSLYLLGAAVEKEDLFLAILEEIHIMYPDFLKDPTAFLASYRANCVTIGRRVHVFTDPPYDGMAEGVTDQGDLVIRTDDDTLHICTSGEVSIRYII